jgi:Putative peptidoglycan binding domain
MKPIKRVLIALTISSIVASSAIARPTAVRTRPIVRTSVLPVRSSAHHWVNNNWRHHRHYRSHIFFDAGFGYPFGYGYPYYGYYPYDYYGGPRETVYQATTADRSLVIEVQRRLARNGYYRGAIDGVIGQGTRNAIRSYERAHGLQVDGLIDPRLLATMGLA